MEQDNNQYQQNNNQYQNQVNQQINNQQQVFNNHSNQQFNKKRRNMLIAGPLILLIALIGITYAFFNYTRTGTANTITTGRVSFNADQAGTINLTNAFPIDSTQAQTDTDNAKSVTITVMGDTDYADGLEYLVTASDVNLTVNNKQLPIALEVSVSSNTSNTPPTTLGTEETGDYYANRSSYTVSKYKILYDGELEEDARILVGYIAPNTTQGTPSGVDGIINIKAYIDKDKILISDTYPSGDVDINNDNETDYTNGTPSSMAEGKVVFTTTEWNSIQSAQTPLSFKVKVEANEGIWIENPKALVSIMKLSAMPDTSIVFTQPSSYNNNSNGNGIYILSNTSSSENPIMYYRGAVDNNYVYFADNCWRIVRTTDTGGVKLIYSGVATVSGNDIACNATGNGTQLSSQSIFTVNYKYDTPAYVGYMWGTPYASATGSPTSGAKFGRTVTWGNYDGVEGNEYKLSAGDSGTIDTGYANGRHYTCNSTDADGTCTEIRYYVSTNKYIMLTDGDKIQDALAKMKTTGNKLTDTSSSVKQAIDTWYSTHMTDYTSKLEDTQWCNDRSSSSLGPWGESVFTSTHLRFTSYIMADSSSISLNCDNQVDRYSVSSENGNGMLDYPAGTITAIELKMAGASGTYNTNTDFYLLTGSLYWTMTPGYIESDGPNAYGTVLTNDGKINEMHVCALNGVRPMVSLKSGTAISGGSGLKTDPYIIL